ncbi:MAG: thioredoxin family protein, partial [Victivallaceae bacterium]
MKRLLVSFILATVNLTACYAIAAESVNWQTDYPAALKTAAAQKKNVLVLFDGYDWCPASKVLEKQILKSAEFQAFANENLVTVMIDFPRTRKLPEAQAKANEALRKQFGIEAFPTMLMLDADGNLLEEFSYNGQKPDEFVIELNRSRMMVPKRNPVPPLEGKLASQEVIKFYDSVIFPPKGKSSDAWSYQRKNFEYYKLKMVTEPLKSGGINQKEADWITGMLKRYFELSENSSITELEKSGMDIYLKEGVAASSYFLACYLWTIPGQDTTFRRILNRSLQEKFLADEKLPLPLRIVYNRANGREIFSLVKHALGSGELEQAHPQFIYRNLSECDNIETMKVMLSRLEKLRIDPWVAKMIAAKIELDIAWNARGCGYANTVTDEGWKEFAAHGKIASKYLEDAWKMHPEWPEAAGLLVYVSCGQSGGDDMVKWFNRAVSAQIDYTPAYKYMLWGLRPRWHGDWHAMLAFGQKAADMEEAWFYTAAPLAFVWAVQDIAGEMDFSRRRAFFQEQLPNVRRVLEKKIAADMKNNNPDCAKHMYAVLGKHLLFCCDYAGAKAALEKANSWDNGYSSLESNGYLSDYRRTMDLEIALATGKSAETVRQIDAAIESGEKEKAARLYFSLVPQTPSTFEHNFLENRIAKLFLPPLTGYSDDLGIFALARCGSVPGVKTFLDAKYDVNVRGKDDCTLLQRSLFMDGIMADCPVPYAESKIAMLKFLMSRGADIHALAGPKWTAQHLAVSNKLPVQVLEFIAKQPGIDLNAGDVDMETPLIW